MNAVRLRVKKHSAISLRIHMHAVGYFMYRLKRTIYQPSTSAVVVTLAMLLHLINCRFIIIILEHRLIRVRVFG